MPKSTDLLKTTDRDLRQHSADIERIDGEMNALRSRVYDDLMDARGRVQVLEQQLAEIDRRLHIVPQRD